MPPTPPFLSPLLLQHFVFDFGDSLSLFGVTCMSMNEAHLLEFETLTSGYINEENDSPFLATINWQQLLREGWGLMSLNSG